MPCGLLIVYSTLYQDISDLGRNLPEAESGILLRCSDLFTENLSNQSLGNQSMFVSLRSVLSSL